MPTRLPRLSRFLPLFFAAGAFAQTPAGPAISLDQPDAQRTREQLSALLDHYPPSLRAVLALDPNLLANQAYLAPYPALASYLAAHPEVARTPPFYIGESNYRRGGFQAPQDRTTLIADLWRSVLGGMAAFLAFGMGIGLVVWLIRTIVDYRRWNRLAKVQAEVHTRILDRLTQNEELLAYMQSQAGRKFLESTPIALDSGQRSMAAPVSRILWSVQAGLVLGAAGAGLYLISGRFMDDAAQPLQVLGAVGMALGVGFVLSAVFSYMISHKLGLLEQPARGLRSDPPSAL